ncbi:MAG TPA: FAD-dependent oxidoreductase [Firmicutes bacterium]|jgi:alkyl hydroperoxide reductase subunit F|nr:FAD-dependent oxidoreductase [Bacillota bacterium]
MSGAEYEVMIIGAGPAGMTAALYCRRKGLHTLILSKDFGGQANWTTVVENYMGFMEIDGPELMRRFKEQLPGENLTMLEDEAIAFRAEDGHFLVEGKESGAHRGKAVIVATGKRPKKLNVPGEDSLRGKGVSYCSTCDAPLFRAAEVAVVGGGNSGVQAVLDLLAVGARTVYLVTDMEITADPVLAEQIQNHPQVRIYPYSRVVAVHGEKLVTGITVRLEQNETEEELAVEGLFIEIGLEPNSEIFPELWKNQRGEIVVDCHCRTSSSGVFAAGDVTNLPEKQIIIAAGEGAKAAITAWEYVTKVGALQASAAI